MIHTTLKELEVPVDGLVPYADNPRRGNVDAIAGSLRTNGQYRPIVVRANTNEVLAGNHTLQAVKQLGWDTIAVTFVDVSDDEAARIVLVDNKSNDDATYDADELLDLLGSLDTLEGTGFSEDDIIAIEATQASLLGSDDDESDDESDLGDGANSFKNGPVISKPGDVWVLGDGHELSFAGSAEEGWVIDMLARTYQMKTRSKPVLKRTGETYDFTGGQDG